MMTDLTVWMAWVKMPAYRGWFVILNEVPEDHYKSIQ
jgi:hypothetical protein